jgi:hypothetical protein
VELSTGKLGIERWLRNSLQRAVCALSSSGALILWRKPRVCAVSAFTLGGLLQCLPGRVETGRRPLTAGSQNDYIGRRPWEPATRPRSRYLIALQGQTPSGRGLREIGDRSDWAVVRSRSGLTRLGLSRVGMEQLETTHRSRSEPQKR